MSFVSYAQNFEDVILWRALHDISCGSYIDIGAQEPVFDSVSYAFYRAGWRGIHVEPTPLYAGRLREARPDETVIEAAVTDAPGPIPFFELGGLSSGREDVAEHHCRNGHQARKILVPTVRLDHLLSLVEGNIHWLKIDVEGMEADVLRSWGVSKVRPWVLAIESTFPSSQETTEQLWIHEVVNRGYAEVFFDGLSRYFVHESHSHLSERLNRPANVFDDFQITSQHFTAALTREEAEAQRTAFEARIGALSLDILQLRERLQAGETELGRERRTRAEAGERSAQEIDNLRARLRSAESELAIEQAKHAQLEEQALQSHAGLAVRDAQLATERQARAALGSELLKISHLAGVDPAEIVEFQSFEQWVPGGSVYGAVKARLSLARDELQGAREFGIQQFAAGHKSRDAEVAFLGERISSLDNEILETRNRIRDVEAKSSQSEGERDRLQSLVEEQTRALDILRSEAAEVDRLVSEVRIFVSSLYASRRGRFALWLGLLLPRPPCLLGAPSVRAVPAGHSGAQDSNESSDIAQQSRTDISVNDIRHTSNLLALNGSAFVDALYRTFLRRSADRAGRDHFIARLQSGDPKEEILLAIATSPEGKSSGAQVEGLAELQRRQSRARRWRFLRTSGDHLLVGRLNRLEYSIGEVHNSVVTRLDRMESSLEQLQLKLESSAGARQRAATRAPGVYVQGNPISIKRGLTMRPSNGAAEFIDQLRESVQFSTEALSLRNGR